MEPIANLGVTCKSAEKSIKCGGIYVVKVLTNYHIVEAIIKVLVNSSSELWQMYCNIFLFVYKHFGDISTVRL